jgi:hypothetical protein
MLTLQKLNKIKILQKKSKGNFMKVLRAITNAKQKTKKINQSKKNKPK